MPKKLLVIGSGAIGIEFASFYNTLGADTTVVEVMDRILPVEDAEISAFAKKSFTKQGMKIMEKSTVKKLDRAKGKVTAHIETGGKTETMEFDTVISAVGIVGNVEGLGLEALGVKVDRTHVVTDEYCRTGVEGLYAIGDIAGRHGLPTRPATRASWWPNSSPARTTSIRSNPNPSPAAPIASRRSPASVIPRRRRRNWDTTSGSAASPSSATARPSRSVRPKAWSRPSSTPRPGELLGAHMIGAEVTELIQGYVVGRTLETTEEDLMNTVFPHPTLSEMMHESVLDAYDRVIHI
jgi:dihydrolipoamide dehydrogenase